MPDKNKIEAPHPMTNADHHPNKGVLQTSDYQFDFKSEHPTSQCTFVVKETVQYYLNGGSSVYVMLLDASKAFA